MRKHLLLVFATLMLSGCVAVPVYDTGYSYPAYGPYPYGYIAPSVSLSFSNFHGGHHGGHGFHRGGHGFHRGGHWGGRR